MINLEIRLHHPWIVLIRICVASVSQPKKVRNVRIHAIDKKTILITWNDNDSNYERCIRTYEIYYTPDIDAEEKQWKSITRYEHVPFLSFCYHISAPNQRLQGISRNLFS